MLVAGIVAAAAICAVAATAAAAPRSEPIPEPVPSLTPDATEELWTRLVEDPRPQLSNSAECRPLRAVFYAATDWLRLATRLAANPSPCAEYSISVPPLSADKTQLRTGQATQIRALGPAFHALAEINVTGWTSWVASNGGSWYEAGVEARRRMAAAGFDVAAGDTWVVNEFSSAVRQGTGSARTNMRALLQGLHDGDGGPPTRGAVFVIGISQPTSDLSLYQARLQDWYEDAPFWSDVSRYVSDWSQELYGDVRNYAAPGANRDARRDALNEYLQHEPVLAAGAPAAGEAARAFLGAAYNPLANAAWRYDAAFGWTDVPVELMQDYVSAQTYAMRSAGNGRFGFAWSPRNPGDLTVTEFNAQTTALLVRLAAAITDSADVPESACIPTGCAGELPGAALTTTWRTFATWKPSVLAITSAPQTLARGVASAPITIELRTHAGGAYTAGLPVPVQLSSSSPTAGFSTAPGGPWTATLTTPIASGASTTSAYFRDLESGTPAIVAATPGKIAASQTVTVTAPDTTPPETTLDSAPTGTVDVTSASLSFSANEPVAGFECSLDGAAFAGCSSPILYTGLGEGLHNFAVRAVDAAGNVDATPAQTSWTVRVTAPGGGGGGGGLPPVATPVAPITPVTPVIPTPAPPAPRAVPDPPPTLRVVGRTTSGLMRNGRVRQIALRFWVSERAQLLVRVTPLGSTRPLSLLPGTTLGGRRSPVPRATMTATVTGGTYSFQARIARPAKSRVYLVRLTAVDRAGGTRTLVIRVRT